MIHFMSCLYKNILLYCFHDFKEFNMKTPFIAGKPVTGKDLIGRISEIQQIMTYVKNGQSVFLIAPRRFGKTSLILDILKRIKNEGLFTSYVDFFSTPTKLHLAQEITKSVLANKKLDNFLANIKDKLSILFKNIEFKQVIEDFEFILDFRND